MLKDVHIPKMLFFIENGIYSQILLTALAKSSRSYQCLVSSFVIIWKRKRELVALNVLWVSYYCKCSVTLSHGVVGWSAVFDCGIS